MCALALTACSDSDSDSDTDAAPKNTAEQSESPSPTDESSEPAAEESTPAGGESQTPAPKSEPGGERKQGQPGIRTYEDEDGGKPTYEVVADGVNVGTNADARKILANADQAKDRLLAVAQVKFTYRGGDPVGRYPKVGNETEMVVDGRPVPPLITFGGPPPEGCDRASTIDTWPQGESHILCRSFLIPPDAKTMEVHWGKDGADPFIWKFDR